MSCACSREGACNNECDCACHVNEDTITRLCMERDALQRKLDTITSREKEEIEIADKWLTEREELKSSLAHEQARRRRYQLALEEIETHPLYCAGITNQDCLEKIHLVAKAALSEPTAGEK